MDSTHWVTGKGPPPSPMESGHLLIIMTPKANVWNVCKKKSINVSTDLVISGLMGWWQRASQMLLNLMKKLFSRWRTNCCWNEKNYPGTMISSCHPKYENELPGDGQLLPPKTLGHTKSRVLVKHRAEFPPPEQAHKNFPPTEPLHNKYKFPSAQIFINFLHLTKLV